MIRKTICSGYFLNSAKLKNLGEYYNLRTGLACAVHPSSCLFNLGYIPDYIIYHKVILTSREYFHCVTVINCDWLAELGGVLFQLKISDGKGNMVIK